MADGLTTQSGAPATVPSATGIAARDTSYGALTHQYIAPIAIVELSGSDDAKVATDVAIGTVIGALTETAPTTDTASSGLNGRLQRIAQRLASLIALLPTALGAGGGLKVDGSGTALPVSAASLPLPSGASTSAKQPALGTAGTASADVISIQGIASMTAVKVDGSAVTQPVSFATATSGGTSNFHAVAAASTNATNIKASAGQVYGVSIFNNAAYPIYVKLHNTSGTPTAGSGVVKTFGVQAGTQRDYFTSAGFACSTGIGITIVKNLADSDTTAVAASDCVVDLDWK